MPGARICTMNPAQMHLALNHLPIFLTFSAALLLAAALWKKSPDLLAAGQVFLMLSAIFALPVFFSGEPTEDLVENQVGIERHDIHEHEESGEFALIVSLLVGAIALGHWLAKRFGKRVHPAASYLVLLGALFALAVFARTAHLGGLIHHPELRP